MRLNRVRAIVMLTLACTLAAGCAPQKQSGFLNDYSKLAPNPKFNGALTYRNPDIDVKKYTTFLIDPIGVSFVPNAQGGAVDPNILDELTEYFRKALIDALIAANYKVVDQPGPGVLQVQIALTGLKRTVRALNIHPLTKLSGVGLGGAAVEAQGIDSETGELVFAYMQVREGDRLALVEGLQEWGHARQAIDAWAKLTVKLLSEDSGAAPQ